MKSATAITHELDDPARAAQELAKTIEERLPEHGNAVGLLFCDADVDGAGLSAELNRLLGMPVLGMTTLAELSPEGRLELSAVLTVLAADKDCTFAPVASAPLDGPDHEQAIADAFSSILPKDDPHGMVFAFCPQKVTFAGDTYANILSRLAPQVPIIGGVASDDYDYERARLFLNGQEYRTSLVALGIFGAVNPRFAMRHVTSRFAERVCEVTHADGNIVYKVGDESFVQYLASHGLDTDTTDPLLAFISLPLMLTGPDEGDTALMRHIGGLNRDDGSGIFLGNVPEGRLANICLINSDNLKDSCRESMQSLLNKAADDHSAVFCFSCCGRAIILGRDADAEGDILRDMLPKGMTVSGAYCLGELCPTHHGEDRVVNRFHNCSITFCIL